MAKPKKKKGDSSPGLHSDEPLSRSQGITMACQLAQASENRHSTKRRGNLENWGFSPERRKRSCPEEPGKSLEGGVVVSGNASIR